MKLLWTQISGRGCWCPEKAPTYSDSEPNRLYASCSLLPLAPAMSN